MSRSMVDQNTIFITENNSDVTTSNNGGNSGVFEEILDLRVPTAVRYEVRPPAQMGDRGGLRVRTQLHDSGDSDLNADSRLKWVGQKPVQEDETQLGRIYNYREFSQADQYNSDEVVRFEVSKKYTFTEDSHLKLKLDSSSAVDWSNSWIELEIVRFS